MYECVLKDYAKPLVQPQICSGSRVRSGWRVWGYFHNASLSSGAPTGGVCVCVRERERELEDL